MFFEQEKDKGHFPTALVQKAGDFRNPVIR